MQLSTIIPAALALATGALAQSASTYTLFINTTTPNPTPALDTTAVSYANGSIWLGSIAQLGYAEPFTVTGGPRGSFSINGSNVYILTDETQPVQFVALGESLPSGGATVGFALGSGGSDGYFSWDGTNAFYACQDAEQASLSTYQIWWFGAGEPNGVGCVGPIDIFAEISN